MERKGIARFAKKRMHKAKGIKFTVAYNSQAEPNKVSAPNVKRLEAYMGLKAGVFDRSFLSG